MTRLALFTSLVLLSSCGALRFDVKQPIPAQEVPGASWANLLTSLLPAPIRLSIDVELETEKQGTGPATSAGLDALTLRALEGNGGTFDFLDAVSVSIGGAGLPTQEVARLRPVPRGQRELTFDVSPGVDLLPYLKQGATLSTSVTGAVPSSTFTFDGEVVVEIRI
ncbi:MAG: hypothetical protein ACOZQL_19640 [Myxococcota bacterium]